MDALLSHPTYIDLLYRLSLCMKYWWPPRSMTTGAAFVLRKLRLVCGLLRISTLRQLCQQHICH
jgi:hypothetical protein